MHLLTPWTTRCKQNTTSTVLLQHACDYYCRQTTVLLYFSVLVSFSLVLKFKCRLECYADKIKICMFERKAPLFADCSGGAKGGPAGARAPAVKPCAPAVPRQLSYSDVDHKRISWLRATDYFEDVKVLRCYQSRWVVFSWAWPIYDRCLATRSSAVAERPHDASLSHSRILKMAPSIDRIRVLSRLP